MGKSPGLRLQASVVQDNLPVEVAPRVFVGSVHAAFHLEALKERHITHVLNLAGHYATFPDAFTYLSLHLRDKDDANLLSCLPAALIFVEAALRDPRSGGVLIHWYVSQSRPAIALIAPPLLTRRVRCSVLADALDRLPSRSRTS
ncbi:hypothetical protein PINS_up000581 [Pythium insidiosum]|nr:hypothetical protein PINS_up000581 [Pythium insidiosum]